MLGLISPTGVFSSMAGTMRKIARSASAQVSLHEASTSMADSLSNHERALAESLPADPRQYTPEQAALVEQYQRVEEESLGKQVLRYAVIFVPLALVAIVVMNKSQSLGLAVLAGAFLVTRFATASWSMGFSSKSAALNFVAKQLQWLNPVYRRVLSYIDRKLTPVHDELVAGYDTRFEHSTNPQLRSMVAGQEDRWGKELYPQLWLDTPADFDYPIVQDGRLIDGSDPAAELAANAISRETMSSAAAHAHAEARAVAINKSVMGIATGVLISAVIAVLAMMSTDIHITSSDALVAPWYMAAWLTMKDALLFSVQNAAILAIALTLAAVYGVVVVMAAANEARDSLIDMAHRLIYSIADHRADHMRGNIWEPITRWHDRYDARDAFNKSWLAAAKAITAGGWDNGSPIVLGKSTGYLRMRGVLAAPTPGQAFSLSPKARAAHTHAFGASGTGKTELVMKPAFIADCKLIADGARASILAMDGKADLHRDLRPIAQQHGIETVMIGCGPNDLGIDLINGVRPAMVAEVMRSVLSQAGGPSSGGGDDFWPERAGHFTKVAATILEAWEYTRKGRDWAHKHGMRPYSLMMIYKMTQVRPRPGTRLWVMIDDLMEEFQDPAVFQAVQDHIAVESLWAAIEYVYGPWQEIAEATLTGIQGNISKALSGFESYEPIRKQFASGEVADFSIEELRQRSLAMFTNISTMDYGMPARVVLIMIQTLVYIDWMKQGNREKKVDQLFLYQDEKQDFITKDLNFVSDANAVNKLRSFGVSFMVATQEMAAYEQVIGEVSTRNFMHNFSNVICLRVRCNSTITEMQRMIGKTLRKQVFENGDVESYATMAFQLGSDPVYWEPVKSLSPVTVQTWRQGSREMRARFRGTQKKYNAEQFMGYLPPRTTYSTSASSGFQQSSSSSSSSDNINAVLQSMQQAEFRAEDKNLDFMKTGNERRFAIEPEDFHNLGANRAVCVWLRGGMERFDVVELTKRMS